MFFLYFFEFSFQVQATLAFTHITYYYFIRQTLSTKVYLHLAVRHLCIFNEYMIV